MMANVIVDTCAFSKDWVKRKVIPDLLRSKVKTKVVYSTTDKWKGKISKLSKYLEFIRLIGRKNRLIKIDEKTSISIEASISSLSEWNECSCCDDEHLFAACLLVNVGYIITEDARLCQCRKIMKNNVPKVISRRRLNFSAISNEKVYDRLRKHIIK